MAKTAKRIDLRYTRQDRAVKGEKKKGDIAGLRPKCHKLRITCSSVPLFRSQAQTHFLPSRSQEEVFDPDANLCGHSEKRPIVLCLNYL